MIPIGTNVKAKHSNGIVYDGKIVNIFNPMSDNPIYRIESNWINFCCLENELSVVD